jgi:alginate O-acetyltransferase complex protein AlgI
MTFASFEFAAFFLLVLAARGASRSRSADNWILLLTSYAFYATWSVPSVLLLLTVSLVDFHVGRRLARTEVPGARKRWLALSVCTNLGLLGFFKYTGFLMANAGWVAELFGVDTSRWRLDVILPVGISFFTFKSMSYTLDAYRHSAQPSTSIRDYLLFVSFFPQLLAGPIQRASDLLPQLGRRVRATVADVDAGLLQFALGAVKKLVLADQLAGHVDLIFAAPAQFDALTLLQGAIGYAVQIYCDFSGYSDMAIGAARIMGFRTPENFQFPYSASDITDFWRRWHISLSSWLRDYLFLPTAYALSRRFTGDRFLRVRADVAIYILAILATFAVCGLWHGASWTFVLWGVLHGVALAVHRAWRLWRPCRNWKHSRWSEAGARLLSHAATLAVVLVGWVLFRAQSVGTAVDYLARMVSWDAAGTRMPSPYILPAFLAVLGAHMVADKDGNWVVQLSSKPLPIRLLFYASLLFVLVSFSSTGTVPFIYSQF